MSIRHARRPPGLVLVVMFVLAAGMVWFGVDSAANVQPTTSVDVQGSARP